MVHIVGTNIISSLGFTTDENFAAVKQGISGVKPYNAGTFNLPEAFMASLIDKEKLNEEFGQLSFETGYSILEKAAILSIYKANEEARINLSSKKVIFILSTTKGNIDLLDRQYEKITPEEGYAVQNHEDTSQDTSHIYLWYSAQKITGFFKNPNMPVVVSNACISGAAAQIAALRALQSGKYDNAIVVGGDIISKFIISGFQSFKALSPELCKPFDKNRSGLNLGEAVATMIFKQEVSDMKCGTETTPHVSLIAGAIRNDATHISAPSRVGEGSYRALRSILSYFETENIASHISFINAHGTATAYNDAMEVQAIVRAGLQTVAVNSLKAYFGHTLGAAGVVESIVSMRALQENCVFKSLNFSEQDFETQLNISKENQYSDKKYYIKMLSGFGGVNAALLFKLHC
jgi:3-oxoacyl-[acyl-carrier-protein] synthase-1